MPGWLLEAYTHELSYACSSGLLYSIRIRSESNQLVRCYREVRHWCKKKISGVMANPFNYDWFTDGIWQIVFEENYLA